MTIAVVIPARYASERLPGKPLIDLAGLPMIIHVWRQCARVVNPSLIWVATDDVRIADACTMHGAQVRMTSADHATGTDRVAELACFVEADTYVSVQGDEPLLDPADLARLLATTIKPLPPPLALITNGPCDRCRRWTAKPQHDAGHICDRCVSDTYASALTVLNLRRWARGVTRAIADAWLRLRLRLTPSRSSSVLLTSAAVPAPLPPDRGDPAEVRHLRRPAPDPNPNRDQQPRAPRPQRSDVDPSALDPFRQGPPPPKHDRLKQPAPRPADNDERPRLPPMRVMRQ